MNLNTTAHKNIPQKNTPGIRGIFSRLLAFVPAVTLVALPFVLVQACADPGDPDVFVHSSYPGNLREFASGKLGVILPSYWNNSYPVAFRYLSGKPLTTEEQSAYVDQLSAQVQFVDGGDFDFNHSNQRSGNAASAPAAQTPSQLWFSARATALGLPQPVVVNPTAAASDASKNDSNQIVQTSSHGLVNSYFYQYVNCPDDAILTATNTLKARAKSYADAQALHSWIDAQDMVFADCSNANGTVPAVLASAATTAEKADRAYQIAAANFYLGNYDQAQKDFQTIATDSSSPWAGIAPYLSARAMVRKAAFYAGQKDTDPAFDSQQLGVVQTELEAMLKKPATNPHYHQAEQQLLDLILYRTNPKRRVTDAANYLSTPHHDAKEYERQLKDYLGLAPFAGDENGTTNKDFTAAIAKVNNSSEDSSELAEWAATMHYQYAAAASYTSYGIDYWANPSTNNAANDAKSVWRQDLNTAHAYALARWQKTPTLPWLVASLVGEQPNEPSATALLSAAAKVPASSPGSQTVTFYRARLLIRQNKMAEARALLDPMLAHISAANDGKSTVNLFRQLRFAAAASPQDALNYAVRDYLEAQYSPTAVKNKPAPDLVNFDADSANYFNDNAPLSEWLEAAQSKALTNQMKEALAADGWVRATLLGDSAMAEKFTPLLPLNMRKSAIEAMPLTPWMTMLRNPGAQPWLSSSGSQPANNQLASSGDSGDQWWCNGRKPDIEAPAAGSSSTQLAEANTQFKKLNALPSGPVLLAQKVLEYAKTHPDDPQVPEALHRVVKSGRFGCEVKGEPLAALTKEAFTLLHHKYPGNHWTVTTPYFYDRPYL